MITQILIKKALRSCSKKNNIRIPLLVRALKNSDAGMHSAFRYWLTKEISDYLILQVKNTKEIYLFGSTIKGNAGLASDIDLMIVPNKKKFSRQDFLRLEKGLVYNYQKLIGRIKGFSGLLDIKIIKEAEVKAGKGIACLASSIHSPAIKFV